MKHALLLLLFAAVSAVAAEDRGAVLERERPQLNTDYRIAPLQPLGRETALTREYYQLLNRYVRYVRPNLRDWSAEPGAKFHKRDGSKELDVRQNAAVAAALSVLSEYGRFDEKLAGASRMPLWLAGIITTGASLMVVPVLLFVLTFVLLIAFGKI